MSLSLSESFGTKTLDSDQLRIKSLQDQKALISQNEKRERARQKMAKAQQAMQKANVSSVAKVRIPVNVTTDSGNVTGNSGERDRWVGVARFNFMPSCFFG